jgi:putative mRNA 3-end processing factor
MRYPELLKDHKLLKKALNRVIPIYSVQDRKIAIKKPSIIVTTAGMLSGGPIIWFLKKLRKREDCSLIFTGFQVPGTPGRYLLDSGIYQNGNVSFPVKMRIKYLDFSAHCSRSELLKFIEKTQPENIVVMHGDHCEEFAGEIEKEFGIRACAPENGEVLEF